MNNFDICYNGLCRAFDKENVIMPSALVKILKPDIVHSCIPLTNTSNIDYESDTTTNNDTDSSDDSNDSNNIDSNKTIQENVNRSTNDDDITYVPFI